MNYTPQHLHFEFQNNLHSVEALQKKHDGFIKTSRKQVDKIEDLKQFAENLKTQDHYASNEITERCQEVLNRCNAFWEHCEARRKKLNDSRNYQLFLRNLYEVTGWINEKLQVALDESYRDPTNLQAKLQKHQAFEAEVTANRNRVDAVVEVGNSHKIPVCSGIHLKCITLNHQVTESNIS